MDDPMNRSVRPPAYALESSSGESDWDEEEQALRPRPSKALAKDSVVQISGASLRSGLPAVVFVGEGGERIARGVSSAGSQSKVLLDSHEVGHLTQSQDRSLVFLSQALPLATMLPLSSQLLEKLSPASLTVISSYHLPSYLPPSAAICRYLSSLSSSNSALERLSANNAIASFAAPNLSHGLAAAIMTASSLRGLPALLFLLPSLEPPPSLNNPLFASSGVGSSVSSYDAGGPTNLSDPSSLYSELKDSLIQVKKELQWDWWTPEETKGNGFDWLEKARTRSRREAIRDNSMYM